MVAGEFFKKKEKKGFLLLYCILYLYCITNIRIKQIITIRILNFYDNDDASAPSTILASKKEGASKLSSCFQKP